MGLSHLDVRIVSAAPAFNGEKLSLLVEHEKKQALILTFPYNQEIDLLTALNQASNLAAKQRDGAHPIRANTLITPTSMKLLWHSDGQCILQIHCNGGCKFDFLLPEGVLESFKSAPSRTDIQDAILEKRSSCNLPH